MACYTNCCGRGFLTLFFCTFGSLTASTGFALLLNVRLVDGNSSTPRTFPAGVWGGALAITMTSGGALMIFLGMMIASCCLTVGIPDKTDSSNSKLFDGETLSMTLDEPVVEVAKRQPEGPSAAVVLAQNAACDMAFNLA